jgi:hypothetical protein
MIPIEDISDQETLGEDDLAADDLEPTETFARLLKIVGDKTSLGSLGLGFAVRQLVKDQATSHAAQSA